MWSQKDEKYFVRQDVIHDGQKGSKGQGREEKGGREGGNEEGERSRHQQQCLITYVSDEMELVFKSILKCWIKVCKSRSKYT